MKPIVYVLLLCLDAPAVWADETPPTSASPSAVTAKNPRLREELLRRTKVDQDARQAVVTRMQSRATNRDSSIMQNVAQLAKWGIVAAECISIDHDNTRWLMAEVEQNGWPTISLVGQDGAHSAWLLVQHADADPKFQRKCLDLMAQFLPNEVSAQDVAYLTDRVLLAEGKKQVYGTQFVTIDGRLQPSPIEDEANADQRRAGIGLAPLAEYAKQLEQIYGSGSEEKTR